MVSEPVVGGHLSKRSLDSAVPVTAKSQKSIETGQKRKATIAEFGKEQIYAYTKSIDFFVIIKVNIE